MTKIFTIVDYPNNGNNYGKYSGINAKIAASKAFSALARILDIVNTDIKNHLVFTIEDINTNKKYKFIGTRIELIEPTTVRYNNGTKVIFRYKNIISKYNDFVK